MRSGAERCHGRDALHMAEQNGYHQWIDIVLYCIDIIVILFCYRYFIHNVHVDLDIDIYIYNNNIYT